MWVTNYVIFTDMSLRNHYPSYFSCLVQVVKEEMDYGVGSQAIIMLSNMCQLLIHLVKNTPRDASSAVVQISTISTRLVDWILSHKAVVSKLCMQKYFFHSTFVWLHAYKNRWWSKIEVRSCLRYTYQCCVITFQFLYCSVFSFPYNANN